MSRRDAFRFLGATGVALAGCKSEDDGTGSVEGDLNPFRCGNGDKFAAATAKAPMTRYLTPAALNACSISSKSE